MLPFLALGLGFKHAFDPDHLLAVSNFLNKSKSAKHSLSLSLSWAAGHMLTASLITFALFTFREVFLRDYLGYAETAVGATLIILGLWTVRNTFAHAHQHKHPNKQHEHAHLHLRSRTSHYHWHLFGIGIVHGLASNDELLTLLVASLGVSSMFGLLGGIALFTVGVVIGMLLFAFTFTKAVKLVGEKFNKAISLAVGGSSVAYGALMLAQLA